MELLRNKETKEQQSINTNKKKHPDTYNHFTINSFQLNFI